jgi:hypothetical protein
MADIEIFDSFVNFLETKVSQVPILNQYAKYSNFVKIDYNNKGTSLFDEYPNYLEIVALWAVGLNLVGYIIQLAVKQLAPEWAKQQNLDKKKKYKLDIMNANVAAIVHHVVVVFLSLQFVYNDMIKSDEDRAATNYTREHGYLFLIAQGYIIGDLFVYAIPFDDVAMIIHHLLFIGLQWGLILFYKDYPAYFTRYVPPCMLCETSGIFLIGCTLLGQAGVEGAIINACKLAFAFSFWIFRILSLPLVLLTILYAPSRLNPPIPRHWWYYFLAAIIYPLCALQFYWMLGIIRNAISGEKKDKKNKKDDNKMSATQTTPDMASKSTPAIVASPIAATTSDSNTPDFGEGLRQRAVASDDGIANNQR